MSKNQTAASMGGTKAQPKAKRIQQQSPSEAEQYDRLRDMVECKVRTLDLPVFIAKVNPERLWKAYLAGLGKARRQHYTCHACRRFIQHYGRLVVLENGRTRSAVWPGTGVPRIFQKSVASMRSLVDGAQIEGVFVTSDVDMGVCGNDGGWRHLSGRYRHPWTSRRMTAGQRQAELLEDYGMLRRVLAKYPKRVLHEAVRVLEAKLMAGSEKALENAKWLAALHGRGQPVLWHAVAMAPAGWCHVNSGMLGTLLEDIQGGKTFAQIKRAWEDKMHPGQYRRPTAAPKAGTIDQAERLVQQMGVERSLERRYATLDDVLVKLWTPAAERKKQGTGVFAGLRTEQAAKPTLLLPGQNMTAMRFIEDVLPGASKLEVLAVHGGNHYGLTTAAHADAPNILQWDNPVSWYVYINGSHPSSWGLLPNWFRGGRHWLPVTAVFFPPYMWSNPMAHTNHARRLMFALQGAKDQRSPTACIFPETLHSDYHSIRSVIEAHSKANSLAGSEAANANGIAFDDKPSPDKLRIRVDGTTEYVIDRWR